MSNGAYKFSPKVLLSHRPMAAKTGTIDVEIAVGGVTIWLILSLKEVSKLIR